MRHGCTLIIAAWLILCVPCLVSAQKALGTTANPASSTQALPALSQSELLARIAQLQQASPAPPAATATVASAPTPYTFGGTTFSAMAEGYADYNPNSPATGLNGLQNFDYLANTAQLSFAKVTIDHPAAPVGFHFDIGAGQTFREIHYGNRDPHWFDHFEQGYVSFKPKALGGIEVDAGEFVTWAGSEVIESNSNWDVTHSLLFAWAIPYDHTGVRMLAPIGSHITAGVAVVNGWNNVYPVNRGKTLGLTFAYAWKKATWTSNYYGGPENSGTTQGWRNLYDTEVLVNPSSAFSYYVNYDYGRNQAYGTTAVQYWTGLAGAARHAIGKRYAVAGRLEWFDDATGISTGTAQAVKEATITGEYKANKWLLSRVEFRDDWSNQPFFSTSTGMSRNQPTLLLGLVAYLGPDH